MGFVIFTINPEIFSQFYNCHKILIDLFNLNKKTSNIVSKGKNGWIISKFYKINDSLMKNWHIFDATVYIGFIQDSK